MSERAGASGRRAMFRGAALSAAGLATGLFAAPGFTADAATAPEPWVYVPPGDSVAAAIRAGARAIALGAGEYRVDEPIVLPAGSQLRGIGSASRLVAGAAVPAVLAIGDGRGAYGVIVADLAIDCRARALAGIDLHIVGHASNWQGDNDATCRLDDLWIWAPAEDGVTYHGADNRAVITTRVRVRQAGRYGFRVGGDGARPASDCWWLACEATTKRRTGHSAGFLVDGGNHFLQACKAWYCRDYGFHVRGTRGKFIGCEAQDTRSHGFYVEFPMNLFNGCSADTAAMWDVGGAPGSADGFYVDDGEHTSLVGCQAFDRGPRGHRPQQRYGFNVPAAVLDEGRLVGQSGWGNTGGLVHAR